MREDNKWQRAKKVAKRKNSENEQNGPNSGKEQLVWKVGSMYKFLAKCPKQCKHIRTLPSPGKKSTPNSPWGTPKRRVKTQVKPPKGSHRRHVENFRIADPVYTGFLVRVYIHIIRVYSSQTHTIASPLTAPFCPYLHFLHDRSPTSLPHPLPRVMCISLGRWSGVIVFNDIAFSGAHWGPLAAVVKRYIGVCL